MSRRRIAPIPEKFWPRVAIGRPNECWEWQGPRNPPGYGVAFGEGAHRVSWRLAHGDIPKGMYVCHACDNKPCVNPAHLWLGTVQSNTRDAVVKGRLHRGSRASWAVLDEASVAEMRTAKASGETYEAIAARYRVQMLTAYNAIRGKTWAHVTTPPVGKTLGHPTPEERRARKAEMDRIRYARNRLAVHGTDRP